MKKIISLFALMLVCLTASSIIIPEPPILIDKRNGSPLTISFEEADSLMSQNRKKFSKFRFRFIIKKDTGLAVPYVRRPNGWGGWTNWQLDRDKLVFGGFSEYSQKSFEQIEYLHNSKYDRSTWGGRS
ncbi:MAG: hypothetical protein MJZ23_06235 [Paludibacteraceae bacterium]|nr:hypothetical protein [Paludibacteraceae bacterium]